MAQGSLWKEGTVFSLKFLEWRQEKGGRRGGRGRENAVGVLGERGGDGQGWGLRLRRREVKSVAVFGFLCLEEGRPSLGWEADPDLVGVDGAEGM